MLSVESPFRLREDLKKKYLVVLKVIVRKADDRNRVALNPLTHINYKQEVE